MFRWLCLRRWRKSHSLSSSEIEVVREILPAEDPRSERLLSQALNVPRVERTLRGADSYEAIIPYVLDSTTLIDLDDDLQSPSIDVILGPTRQKARFHIHLLRGGFLHRLVGRTLDCGPWPLEWTVLGRTNDNSVNEKLGNWLPRELRSEERNNILDRLARWTGVPIDRLSRYGADELRVYLPCNGRDIAMLEQREQLSLPNEYRSLLKLTNGIDVILNRPFTIGGTRDLRKIVQCDNPCWLITDLHEFGAVLMEPITGALTLRRGNECESITSLQNYIVETIQMLDMQPPEGGVDVSKH